MRKATEFTIQAAPSLKELEVDAALANLATFKLNYRKNLPVKVDEIQEVLAGVVSENPESLKHLYVKFYHLAGTSGTIGAASVSQEAGKLANLLQPIIDENASITQDLVHALERGLSALREAAHRECGPDADMDVPSQQSVPAPSPLPIERRSEIFLVDDDPEFAEYLTLFLERLGHRVYAYQNPSDFQAVAEGINPKAILIDLVFKEGLAKGASVIQDIQSHRAQPVPVIFMSYRDDVLARIMAADAQGIYYFKKPIDESRLLMALDRIAIGPAAPTYRVVIVNPDVSRGKVQVNAFREAGMDAQLIEDPMHTFHAMGQFRPDQVILDTEQVNAAQLVRAIGQHEAFFHIPVSVISHSPNESGLMKALEAGAETVIPVSMPPLEMAQLVKTRLMRLDTYTRTPEATTWTP